VKTLNHSWDYPHSKKQANNEGKSKEPPLIDPLPTLKEKLLARKCRKLARQLLKREQKRSARMRASPL
jgi:hypothetical protein